MSEKKKKNVQPVEAQKADPDSSKVLPQEPAQTVTVEAVPQQFTLIKVPKLSKEQVEAAKAFNFPVEDLFEGLNAINVFANSVEERFGIIQHDLAAAPQKVVEALKAEALKRQQEATQQMAQQTQQGGEPKKAGGSGLMDMLALAKEAGITGGGGGMDEEVLKLTKEMMHMNIERMRQDMGFTEAVKNAIVTKIASKAVTEII
jgi:hypothetical protein